MELPQNKKLQAPSLPDSVYKSMSKGLVKSVESIESEFIGGFEFISGIKRGVTIFGSGRLPSDNIHYKKAQELAKLLAKENFTVITGGGPGIMEAANRGAYEGGGESIGLNILLPQGQDYNKYVKKGIMFNHFFTRKVMFAAASFCYVYFPGGFGTLDEFFEMINSIHNQKIHRPPLLIAVGKDYWQPLFDWLHQNVYEKHHAISTEDFKLVHLVDSPKDALEIILKSAQKTI